MGFFVIPRVAYEAEKNRPKLKYRHAAGFSTASLQYDALGAAWATMRRRGSLNRLHGLSFIVGRKRLKGAAPGRNV